MSVLDVIRKRRSIRKYENRDIEQEKLDLIFEAGRLAPSACNLQNRKFVFVTDKEKLEKLAHACNHQKFVAEAPAAIVVCSEDSQMISCGQSTATIDCSIALSFMILEATELGLGTCWLGSVDPETVKEVLDLPKDYTVVAVSPLGYTAEVPAPRPRKSIDQILIRR